MEQWEILNDAMNKIDKVFEEARNKREEVMTIDQLKPFCSTDSTRYALEAPFSKDAWTFATNGHICIRVPRLAEVPEVEGAPDCVKMFSGENFEYPARAWVDVPEPVITTVVCHWCKGTGFIRSDISSDIVSCRKNHKNAEQCEECNAGAVRSGYNLIAGPKGEAKFAGRYIELIKALPNPKIGLLGNESDWKDNPKANRPVCFRFDGGDGLLMPVRK